MKTVTGIRGKTAKGGVRWLVLMSLVSSAWLPLAQTSQTRAEGLSPGKSDAPTNTPILLVVNPGASNPFGTYLAEILKAEGLNAFDIVTLNVLTTTDLTTHDVIVLAETALTAPQAALMTKYVGNGGRLVAMRPDVQIASLFGLLSKTGELDSAYMAIDQQASLGGNTPGYGLPGVAMQYHGVADLYTLRPGALNLARLQNNSATPSAFPAVSASTNVSSGIGVAFTYDLARSVLLTRQGNPVWSSTALTTGDLFAPHSGTTWLDLSLMNIPQADEQQRLFARIISQLASVKRPMPQFWYFPGKAKSILLATVNSKSNPIEPINDVTSAVNRRGGKATLFVGIGGLQPTDITGLLSAGHSVSPWVTDYRIDSLFPPYDISNLQQGFEVQTYEFNLSNGVSPSQPVRTVGGVWKGWTTGAQFAANQGYGMDYSYASQGSWLKQSNGKWARGYVNGSGRPMKFISITGTVLPVYQQGTDLIDEQLMEGLIPSSESLGISAAIDASRQQIDASVSSNYGAVVAETQMTTYRFNGGFVAAWFEGTLDYAVSKGLPILTGQQWWVFNNIRDNAHYTQINWNDAAGKLTFNQEVTTNITSTAGVSLTTLLPVIYKNRSLRTVFVDGVNTPFSIDNLKTTNMIWVTVSAGPHTFEATYQTDAAIGNLAATVASDMPRFLYQPVRFDASVDAGTQVTYLWDFGDGGIGSGPNPMHVYRQFGTGVYTVSVTATNAAGSRFGTVPVTLTLPAVSYMPIVQK